VLEYKMEYWSGGVMELWSGPNTPVLHYSMDLA
jgi:hypothetical protein